MALDTYQLLDADLRHHGPFTPTQEPLTRVSSVEAIEEKSSAVHPGLDGRSSTQPPGWNVKQRKLEKTTFSLVSDTILDIVMVLTPLAFLMLAAEVASIHGREVEPSGSKLNSLTQATKTASTLFTVVFAAIIGRTAKKYSTWSLERGSALGHLEQVMQSTTLAATISTQASLRMFGPLSFLLLSIWSLSPLGSQSCLRIFSIQPKATRINQEVQYVDTMANRMFQSFDDGTYNARVLNPIYVASILSPPSVKNSSMDLWGNVKIPYLPDHIDLSSDKWLPITNSAFDSSSLLGIPLNDMESGITTLALESTYIGLNCSPPSSGSSTFVINQGRFKGQDDPNDNGTFWSVVDTTGSETSEAMLTSTSWTVATDVNIPGSNFLANFTDASILEVNQSRLLFQSALDFQLTTAVCGMTQIYVESNVTCSVNDSVRQCAVTTQRPSQLPHASSNLTVLSFSDVFKSFSSVWCKATGLIELPNTSPFDEYYLQNTSTAFILGSTGVNGTTASLANTSATDFSKRLGQLLNTYLLGSQISSVVAGGQSTVGVDSIIHNGTTDLSKSTGRNTTATLTQSHEVYVCSWGWLTVLLVSSSVMLTASLMSIWWELQTRIPDILGYCSTLTRDAPYLNLPGGDTLDGLERTRLLKDYRITLGVVKGSADEGVGHIAVAPAGRAERPVKGKLYA